MVGCLGLVSFSLHPEPYVRAFLGKQEVVFAKFSTESSRPSSSTPGLALTPELSQILASETPDLRTGPLPSLPTFRRS